MSVECLTEDASLGIGELVRIRYLLKGGYGVMGLILYLK